MKLEQLRELSDKALVRRSARGDQDAFEILFERKHRHVYLTAYQVLGDQGRAEDVVQETFLALWKHCARYRPRFALDTWLRHIATNKAIDRYRVEKRHPHPSAGAAARAQGDRAPSSRLWSACPGQDDPHATAADATLRARAAEIQRIWNELAEDLSPQQRGAFVLRVIEGSSASEVAEALGCSLSTVRSHVALARKSLRAGLAARYPEYLQQAHNTASDKGQRDESG